MKSEPASQAPSRVLIVEDEPSMRTLLHKILDGAGFAVDEAGDGVEGLERLTRHDFDVVLLDVWMPRMNGLEVLSELHRRGSNQRVILMSADHAPETLLRGTRAGQPVHQQAVFFRRTAGDHPQGAGLPGAAGD